MLKLNVVEVDTPTKVYTKARAELSERELIVKDRRGNTVDRLETTEDWTPLGEGAFKYIDADGNSWTVTPLKKCGCGGMTTRDKS